MAQAPSIQQDNNNSGMMVCYTANGQPVSVFSSTGSCPMGFFSKPPDTEDAFEVAEEVDTFMDDYDGDDEEDDEEEYIPQYQICFSPCEIFSGWETPQSQEVSYIGGGDCPASHPFSTKPLCKIPDDVNEAEEEYIPQYQICHSPCKIFSGSENQQSYSVSAPLGTCPASYPFSSKPNCEIPDDVQERFDAYQNQIDALLEDLANSNSSEDISDLTEQLEALQAQLEESKQATLGVGYIPPAYEPAPKQAGFGNIPTWAIIGGVTLVAIIVIMSSRRQQPVFVKG
jgi:hypothetical protein